jgi:flagellin-like protein
VVEMRSYTSVGLSPLVAVILLIAITVAAAVVVSGVFFNLARHSRKKADSNNRPGQTHSHACGRWNLDRCG